MKSKVKLTQEFISKLATDVQDSLAVALKDVENQDELHIIRKSIDDEPTVMPMEETAKRLTIGYASTRSVDLDHESILPDGMDLSIYRKNPVLLWAHNWSTPPIGRMPEINSDGVGLRGISEYASTKFASDIWELVKGKFLRTHSIGFIPTEYAFRGDPTFEGILANAIRNWPEFTAESAENVQRFIVRGIMLENSVVPIPANPDALIQEVAGKDYDDVLLKSLSGECPGLEKILEEAARQANGGVEPDENDDSQDDDDDTGKKKKKKVEKKKPSVVVLRSPVRVISTPKVDEIKVPTAQEIIDITDQQLNLMKGKV